MRALSNLYARVHDVWVGRCSICGCPHHQVLCDECRRHQVPRWSIDGVPSWAAARYDGRLRELIQRLKYRDETRWAALLGRLLHERLCSFIPPHCTLIPVPLHAERLVERGYNQSALLARALGRHAKIPVRTDILMRSKSTKAQATLGADARRENLRGAFRVLTPEARPLMLLDDVATTGTTLRECILCLRRAGAIVEAVVTVAIAESDGAPA